MQRQLAACCASSIIPWAAKSRRCAPVQTLYAPAAVPRASQAMLRAVAHGRPSANSSTAVPRAVTALSRDHGPTA